MPGGASLTDYHDGQQPWHSERIDLGCGYDLYYEQSGRRDGVPVLYLHGGPGAGLEPAMRRFHDPSHYGLVMFDQRGAGASRPWGDVRRNTAQLLVGDIELLRTMEVLKALPLTRTAWAAGSSCPRSLQTERSPE
jgi:proline iminopeptidase